MPRKFGGGGRVCDFAQASMWPRHEWRGNATLAVGDLCYLKLQCDRATNGAEINYKGPEAKVIHLLQCDRATNGAEMQGHGEATDWDHYASM